MYSRIETRFTDNSVRKLCTLCRIQIVLVDFIGLKSSVTFLTLGTQEYSNLVVDDFTKIQYLEKLTSQIKNSSCNIIIIKPGTMNWEHGKHTHTHSHTHTHTNTQRRQVNTQHIHRILAAKPRQEQTKHSQKLGSKDLAANYGIKHTRHTHRNLAAKKTSTHDTLTEF